MKTKKEIFQDILDKKAEQNDTIDLNAYAMGIIDALDSEFADEQSVAFAEWCDKNATQSSDGKWLASVKLKSKINCKYSLSTNELLDIFKEQNLIK